ncbi:hypothetical protein ACWD2L_05825 [Streptomyces sp. NPDC002754]
MSTENTPVEDEFIDDPFDLWSIEDRETVVVAVPMWNGRKVRLRVMSAAERDSFEASTVDMRKGKQRPNIANLRARLVARCVVNKDGELVFQSGDVARLGQKSARALDFLFQKCQEINGFTEADIEELAEDFDETTDSDSSTD